MGRVIVEVNKEVDAEVGEDSHAGGVIESGSDVVSAKGVYTNGVHEVCVASALVDVNEGVDLGVGASAVELVCNTWSKC